MKVLILIFCLFFVNVYGALERVDPLVLTSQGLVKGIKATDGDYSKFLGIPYAKVDLNDPFGAARAAPQFEEEIFNAHDNSRRCPQIHTDGTASSDDEAIDCLQLSLYVPYQASSHNPLPVLVWIHGGGFKGGSANTYDTPILVKQGVIVVTVNYRVGPYGFMCLDNPNVPGNQGLKDQYVALRWVRDNIAAFGGNPYNVTLAGHGSGSASVLLQLYSPKEKVFNKVIAESGTPFSLKMFGTGDTEVAIKLANYLGLNTTDNQQALEFLTQTHHSLVTGAAYDLKIDFKPCKERSFSGVENFIDSEPYALSNERKIRNTPILIGNTDEEYVGNAVKGMEDDYYEKDFFYTKIEQAFNLEADQLEKVAEIVRHYYIGDKPITEELIQTEAAKFQSDFVLYHPVQDTIASLIKDNANPVYSYVFTYVGDSGETGAHHGDEVQYLFDSDETRKRLGNPTDEDLLVADRLATLWANFVKYGNPTPSTSDLITVKWTPVTETTRPYLNIGSELRMEDRFLKERNAFWDLFHSVYGKYSNLARQCDHDHY